MKSNTPAKLKRTASIPASESKLSTSSSIHQTLAKSHPASKAKKAKKAKSKSNEVGAAITTPTPAQPPAFYSKVRHTIPHLDVPGLGLGDSDEEYKPIKWHIKF